jgi:Concanavalin A-like lectin/glucanases superfamily/Domain of unknown function (DUF2341)
VKGARIVAALSLGALVTVACSLTADLSGMSGGQVDGGTTGTTPAADGGGDAAKAEVPVAGWTFRKPLRVQPAGDAQSSDLPGFPLLVSLTDPDLRTVANGGKVATGKDLAFFAADGVTALAHEIEAYTPATGVLIAWVKVPLLSASLGTDLFVAFGNPAVASSLEDRAAVWRDDYAAVWHMSDNTWSDSTGPDKGTSFGGATTSPSGKIGSGGVFGAEKVYVAVGNDAKLRPTSITVSVWAKPESVGSAPDRHPYMLRQDSWRAAGSDPRGYYLEIYRTQTAPHPTFYTANATAIAHAHATTDVVNGTWYHVVGTRDEGSGKTTIYVNGEEEGSASMIGPIAYNPNVLQLGGAEGETWDGMLDEVRISKVARPAAWIRAEYLNQTAPESFVKAGATEAAPR